MDNKNVVFTLLMMYITCPRIARGQQGECAMGGVDNRRSGQQAEWTTGGVDNRRSRQQKEWTTGGVDNRRSKQQKEWTTGRVDNRRSGYYSKQNIATRPRWFGNV